MKKSVLVCLTLFFFMQSAMAGCETPVINGLQTISFRDSDCSLLLLAMDMLVRLICRLFHL